MVILKSFSGIFLFVVLFLIHTQTFGAEFKPGTTIESFANVNFRESKIYGFWSNPDILKVIKPGDRLTVIETDKIKVPFVRNRVWLKVKDTTTDQIGWVYNGKTGDKGYFTTVDPSIGGTK